MQKSNAGEEAKKPSSQAQVSANSPQLTAGQIQTLTRLKGQPNTIVVPSAGSGVANLSTLLTVPRGISGQTAGNAGVSLATSSSRIVSPQAINIIQRQIPTSGVVGLSCVTAEGLQQVLQGTPLTLVTTASPEAAVVLEQQRKQSLLHQQRRQPQQQSGATIHHLGPRGLANPISNQHASVAATMSNIRQLSGDSSSPASSALSISSSNISSTLKDVKLPISSGVAMTRGAPSPITKGPSPKKIKLEEQPIHNSRIVSLRRSVSNHKRLRMREVKSKYRDHLTELFYLQAGGNMVEFQTWKKRPTQPLLNFLEGSRLDSDDDDDRLQEKRINDEVKVLTSTGSNIPVATPVAIATTLPPSVSALSQQGSSHILASPFSINNPKLTASAGIDDFLRQLSAYVKAMHSSSITSSLATTSSVTSTSSELQQHLTKSGDVKTSHSHKGSSSQSNQPIAAKSIKSQATSPGRSRQAIASVYENVTGGSQDVIVERAKQEAQVIQRVNELRKEGLWSAKRLPRVQEPPRQKAHWDYLLEEMTWLAADFIQERKWKKATSRKISRMIASHFREKEMKEIKAEKEEAFKLKKIASQMAKMVKEFWSNIEKVVQYKQTTRMEEKKKKALDLHLSFIVDQTEKYSSWLTAGLQSDNNMSKGSSLESDGSDLGDVEFKPVGTASDDEETIEKEECEAGSDEDGTKEELEALKKESELPIEEVLKSLPKEMLDMPSSGLDFDDVSKDGDSVAVDKEKDHDFTVDNEDDRDEEETLEEQEKHEKDYTEELGDLKAEGELSVEELMKKYAGAYDSDFDMPEEESSDDDDDSSDDEDEESSEKETGESEDDEEMEDDQNSNQNGSEAGKEAVGLAFLVKQEGEDKQVEQKTEEGPGKEFNDIAAAAQSLQPKGYTLETTEVKTKVPFLLKHTLREYQHVGLDWLATMHEKRLNGILADEMGLGKTIQTIALLAHLACEKGTWGPHLIVVPTSVMLNWEMEIKKWCPAFKILTYYGSIKERKLKRQGWTKTNAFHVCITSYKLVVQDHQAFRRKKWKYFILDEAQNIKNFKSQRWQMLLNFSSQRRLLLTGTPLQNSLMELWSLMHFLMPNVFQSHSEFKEWFSNPLTGMIEGSQEYNESLVRRLHKVLRPFLLRRLKNEVEKQMPQKFEHVVMCRLSKRQRFLYDDFMSQSKTRETLASGHFMSVINILMQLRKVCNHPNLFDPRPVISPFKMEGIVYRTASMVANALAYDPFRDIDIYSLYPSLVDMETNLPAFVAQRVKRLQAPRKLIEEVDSWPATEPRPPPGQLKNLKLASSSAALQTSDSTTSMNSKAPSSSTIKATVAPTIQTSQSSAMSNIKLLLPSSSSPSAQQSILIPNPNGSGPPIILPLPTSTTTSGASSVSSTSAAIAQAKLISSQLQSGLLHLVQTSSGHQVITVASTSGSSTTASNPITTATASSSVSLSLSSSSLSLSSSSSSNVSVLKISSSSGTQDKPVMKVTPFVVSSSTDSSSSKTSPALSKNTGSLDSTAVSKLLSSHQGKVPKKPVNSSELFLESLYRKKEERRRHILAHMAKVNKQKCSATPVMGPDARAHLQCFDQLSSSNCFTPSSNSSSSSKSSKAQAENASKWTDCKGYTNCLFAQERTINHSHPNVFWRECEHLVKAVRAPEDHIQELQEILHRYVFATPPVISPNIQLHLSHPTYSRDVEWCESHLKPFIHQHSTSLHPVQLRTMVQFPEPRLIQYDCGKLQTMDILLRRLKTGQHRVLIFTQMTKMLDVLEAFLNFHGHRYLRLDGTTKVEQRQFLMDRFNADPRIFCFILSTRSGGIGVNLTGADTVIFYDSDWNPTMDAQAQDRCHRIGQTRDVHIYRLVSEMTVEENILKKANQKRLLGDLAIEGGNFTTAFFKEQTISDLFAEPSGLQSLVEAKEERLAKSKESAMETDKDSSTESVSKSTKNPARSKKEEAKRESAVMTQFEQALCKAEDEPDAQAVKLVQAEQKAELAEFDENIPWDEREAELRKEEDEISKVEMELAMLDKELTPIERYAVLVVEAQTESETAEELKMAEEDIENSKKDWELARLKALKEEEERKAELEDDEMLYIYSKDESQVKKKGKLGKKGQNKRGPKPKPNTSMSESDESASPNRRARDRQDLSPKISSPRQNLIKTVKKAVKTVEKAGKQQKAKMQRGRPRKSNEESPPKGSDAKSKTKIKVNGSVLQSGSKVKVKKQKNDEVTEGKKQPKVKKLIIANAVTDKEPTDKIIKADEKVKLAKEKKEKAAAGSKSPVVSLVNGHSPQLSSKLTTQARNALLKKQALQAGHIDISKANDQALKSPNAANANASPLGSPQVRMPSKPSTPKSTPPDPNVPPPWSNPNLVIRTRKAAVHSPVLLTRARVPNPNPVSASPTVIQQNVTRFPAGLALSGGGVRIQATPGDRNIFQLFNSNTPGIRLAGPTIRQISSGPIVNLNQAGATLLNPASLMNTVSLSGARFITTGVAGTPSSIIATGTTKTSTAINVGGNNVSTNIALVPTVLNPGARGQTTILTQQGNSNAPASAVLNQQGRDSRTILNATRLASPITLQGVGGVPVAVNLIKTNTGIATVPIRHQQIIQASSLASISGNTNQSAGYVFITPRPRITTSATGGVVTVQTAAGSSSSLPANPNAIQNTRLVLAPMPAVAGAATVIQQPRMATVLNRVSMAAAPLAAAPPIPNPTTPTKKDN